MNCPACTAAQRIRYSGKYQAGCLGCSIRGLAQSLGYAQSKRQGALTRDYKRALSALFAGDVAAGHEKVKAEAERLERMK